MATTVTWVQDGSGRYEVSSPQHLKQIMHKGTLYTDAGSFPTDYYSSLISYIQTVDIDLFGDSTDIIPIGNRFDLFRSDYDGGNFQISSWSYLDPEFSTSNDCVREAGLFGGSGFNTIKNMRLTGVWTVEGCRSDAGFLAGYYTDSSSNISGIFNIVCDFSPGTFIDQGQNTTDIGTIGSVVGSARMPIFEGIVVKGSVDFGQNTFATRVVGGVAGELEVQIRASLIVNMAVFPQGIDGRDAGGICGQLYTDQGSTVSKLMNAMTGDISATESAGGLIGEGSLPGGTNGVMCDSLVNSMTGNITYTGSISNGGAGGIAGHVFGVGSISRCINYMTGDILSKTGVGRGAAGLFGYFNEQFQHQDSSTVTYFSDSICAMNGTVDQANFGSVSGRTLTTIGSLDIETFVGMNTNTNFGLTLGSIDVYGTSTPPQSMLTLSEFPDLPYVALDGVGEFGELYDFDFVYANLAGNSSFTTSHLIVRNGNLTFQDGVVLTTLPPLSVSTRAVNIPVTIAEVSGAFRYNVTIEGPTGGEVVAISGTTTLEHNITGLDPETQYTVRLYADTGSGYVFTEKLTTTTLPNIAANYDVADLTQDGVVNLRSLPESTISNINEVIDQLLNTGDRVSVSVADNPTSFINLGDTLSIKEISGVLLPFVATSGAGQGVSVILSDESTTVPINYDDTMSTITVEGVVYHAGDSFMLDGKKVTVIEY